MKVERDVGEIEDDEADSYVLEVLTDQDKLYLFASFLF